MLDFGPDAIELAPPGRAVADPSLAARAEPDAKADRPWVLRSASALRLPPPPGERESATERQAMRKLAAGDDAAAHERIRYWDGATAGQRWDEMFAGMSLRAGLEGPVASLALYVLHVAVHDARIAAHDSRDAHRRPRPGEMDARLVPEVTVTGVPSYPCEHAVIAGAAAAVLAHLFPAEADHLAAAADEAAWSRVTASAVYPSDAEAGLALGRAVAAQVIDAARADSRRSPSEALAIARQ